MTWFGIIDLSIGEQESISPITTIIGAYLLFMINLFFLYSITLKVFNKKIVAIILGYTPIYILCLLVNTFVVNLGMIGSTVVPVLYAFIINYKLKFTNTGRLFKHFGIYYIVMTAYQIISCYIKLKYFQQLINSMNFKSICIYSIDLIIFNILIYMGVRLYELVGRSGKIFNVNIICAEIKSIFRNKKQSQEHLDVSGLTPKQTMIFILIAQGFQFFQLAVVLLIGFLNVKFIEIIIMIFMFLFGRYTLGKCYHSDKLWICSVVTFGGFYVLSHLSLPLSVSIFSCISLSATFTYCLHKIAILEEEYYTLKEEKEKVKEYKLEPLCDKNILIEICKAKDMSVIDTDLLIERYSSNKTYVEMQVKFNYSERHLRRLIDAATKKFYK